MNERDLHEHEQRFDPGTAFIRLLFDWLAGGEQQGAQFPEAAKLVRFRTRFRKRCVVQVLGKRAPVGNYVVGKARAAA